MLCLTEFVLKACSRAVSSEDRALCSLLKKQNKQQQQQQKKTFLSHHQDTSPAASDVCRANTPCRAFSFPYYHHDLDHDYDQYQYQHHYYILKRTEIKDHIDKLWVEVVICFVILITVATVDALMASNKLRNNYRTVLAHFITCWPPEIPCI